MMCQKLDIGGNGAYEVRFPLKNDAEIDFVFNLLRQTINKNKE